MQPAGRQVAPCCATTLLLRALSLSTESHYHTNVSPNLKDAGQMRVTTVEERSGRAASGRISTITGHGCLKLEGIVGRTHQLKNTTGIVDVMAPGDVWRLYQVVSRRRANEWSVIHCHPCTQGLKFTVGSLQVLPLGSMQVLGANASFSTRHLETRTREARKERAKTSPRKVVTHHGVKAFSKSQIRHIGQLCAPERLPR